MLIAESVARAVIAAIAAAVALFLVAPHATPIDRALPFVAVVLVLLPRVAQASLPAPPELSIPLLVLAAVLIPDEHTRLLTYGLITAASFAATLATSEKNTQSQTAIALPAIVILRWLPTPELWRELIVLAGAVALIAAIRDRSPLATIAVVAVALVTPTHPGKAALFPFVVAIAVAALRTFPAAGLIFFAAVFAARASLAPLWFVAGLAIAVPLLRRARVEPVLYAIAIVLFALWPWSGLVARAMPRFFAAERAREPQVIGRSLAASQSLDVAATSPRGVVVTLSGANVSQLHAGKRVAQIETIDRHGRATRRDVAIGDVADFGFLRREQFFASRNPLPRVPLADIRGYGIASFLYGAGRVHIAGDVAGVRITAASDLPRNALIEVESVEEG